MGSEKTMQTNAKTIYALASARGVAGIAVIRISGQDAENVLTRISRKKTPEPRKTAIRTIYTPFTNPATKLDEAMVIYFQAPYSFTGEDCVELHIHGGLSVIDSVLKMLSQFKELRLAQPGEFTRRAFDNGKLDLTQAEAVCDLIHAETQAQQSQALAQLEGNISDLYNDWNARLKKLLAYCEAELDFPDEDLPDNLLSRIEEKIVQICNELKHHFGANNAAEKLREGVFITLIGPPNAGKSSLINALAQDDVAIVTDIAGTTRDVLDVRVNIGGYLTTLTDTAGLREVLDETESHNLIEIEGIKRAIARAQKADHKILVFDQALINDTYIKPFLKYIDDKTIIALNKSDLSASKTIISDNPIFAQNQVIKLSAKNGEGIEDLISLIRDRLQADLSSSESSILTRTRHKEALKATYECLMRAVQNNSDDELLAEDLRLSLRALGRLTGTFDVEDLLDIVFKDFCIGK